MNVENKCRLSATSERCVGFQEGMFVRFYQQGLYTWNQLANIPLKICGRQIKKLNGVWLLSGGLPLSSFISQYPDLHAHQGIYFIETAWGNDDYEHWYQREITRFNSPTMHKKRCNNVHTFDPNASLHTLSNIGLQWALLTSTRKDKKNFSR